MSAFTPPHLLDGHRWRGLRIGLLGGSFNPAHAGHVHVSLAGIKALGLDCVWWIVTPQNPLKKAETAPIGQRMQAARALTRPYPRILITDLEHQAGTSHSVETVNILKTRFPGTHFVFLAGTDIALQLPRWYRWRSLNALVPLAFVARPPAVDLARTMAVKQSAWQNHPVDSAVKSALLPGKVFWIGGGPLHPQASSKIRNPLQNN